MKWSLKLGKIKGIDIKIHVTFFLIILWGAFQFSDTNDAQGLIYGAMMTVLLFVIVLLHELGHSLAALRFNVKVYDITLLPIGGLARLEEIPKNPFQEFVIAIAGPMVNVLLAALLFPLLWWVADGNVFSIVHLYNSGPGLLNILRFLFWINVSLLLFNMIPAFPLDGGRALRSLLAIWLGNQKATRIAVWIGQGFAILMGLYGIYVGNYFLAVIAIFIYTAGGVEGKLTEAQSVLDSICVRQILPYVGNRRLAPNFTMIEAAATTMHNHQVNFPVLLGDTLVGAIRRRDIREAMEQGKSYATVAEIMRRDIPTLDANASLSETQTYLQNTNSPLAAVYEDSHFAGLISFEDIEHAFRTFRAKRKPSHHTLPATR